MPAITNTWTLSQTVTDVVSVSKGILTAATSDNVQALAVLACEAFGTTLAMSPETCGKVHQLCSQSHESAMVTFLKAKVGYRKGDCGWQLAQSDPGTRFLGLAASLISLDHWMAAEALKSLILDTATDKRPVPTAQQLKHLIQVLEYKLGRSSFSESALGWSIWLSKETKSENFNTIGPSREVLVQLVKAISSVCRIGQAEKLEVTVPITQAPWIIAFVKWCVGTTPNVVLENETVICTEPKSPVIIRVLISNPLRDSIEISTLNEIGEVRDLIKDLPDGFETFRGMVGMSHFAKHLMSDLFGPETSTPFRACVQALPYACAMVLKFFRLLHLQRDGYKALERQTEFAVEQCIASWGNVFPQNKRVASTVASFLGVDPTTNMHLYMKEVSDGFLIHDLPLLIIVKDMLHQKCSCVKCKNTTVIKQRKCEFDQLINKISICVGLVMQLSLVDATDPEGVQLYFGSHKSQLVSDEFTSAINDILEGGKPAGCKFTMIIRSVLQVFGHKTGNDLENTWIMSSYRGQTLYPRLMETMVAEETGAFSLICIPGALWFKEEKYAYVNRSHIQLSLPFESSSLVDQDTFDLESQDQEPVATELAVITGPADSFAGHRIVWRVSKAEESLTVRLICPDFPSLPQRAPLDAVVAAAESLFVHCSHGRNTEFTDSNAPLCRTNPAQPVPNPASNSLIGIVQCDRNEKMRFFTLAAGQRGVIRGDACIQCCIKCCRIAGLKFVVC